MLLPIKQRHCFYHALAIMAVYPSASSFSRRGYRKVVKQLLARMKQWTKIVPDSTLSKYWLMQAEWARLEHKQAKAAKLYDQAIRWAQETGYSRDEAIANELAAQYFLSIDNHPIAEAYLQHACKAYFKWGAEGKVNSMRERYPILRELSFPENDPSVNSNDSADQPFEAIAESRLHDRLDQESDMDTLRQVSQMASKNNVETEWLESFLDLAIRSAGAERGFVMLGNEGKWVVESKKEVNRKQEKRGDHRVDYSAAVVQFVMRTRESVVLGEARHSLFASDPYIRQERHRSILCLPIRYPDHRFGVLYLENNLTSDAFTADRLEVLELAFSRIAYLKLWQSPERNDPAATPVKGKAAPVLIESLSKREMDILGLMAEGLSNKEIALRLEITEGTVKIHAYHIYGKLQVKRRVQAISKARELRILE